MKPGRRVSYFGRTNFRHARQPFGILQPDRLSHLYLVGKTGVGKSTMIETLIHQDIVAGRGCALVDPHGDLAERVFDAVPREQRYRLTYLDVPNPEQPYGYNPLKRVRLDKIPLAVAGLLETFRKLWPDAWGVRMEHVLRNSLYALLEQPGASLPDVLRLYSDDSFRKSVTNRVGNEVVRRFWADEFEQYPPRLRAEAVAPIQNKLGALLADPALYRVLVTPSEPIRFRHQMDTGGIIIINIAKGRLGEDATHLLGGLIVSTIALAAFSRAETPSHDRCPFFLYVDEFQSFTTLSFVNMLSELRKYGVGLTLAHQHLHQLVPDIRHAVLGNVATLVAFRVGPEDAFALAREFAPVFGPSDLTTLPNQHIYVRLMIEGSPSRPFSAQTLAPADLPGL